jgi:hypothetical protein
MYTFWNFISDFGGWFGFFLGTFSYLKVGTNENGSGCNKVANNRNFFHIVVIKVFYTVFKFGRNLGRILEELYLLFRSL